ILREVTDFDAVGDGDRAGVGDDLADEDFEKGCFARAVGADEPESLAALDVEVELVEERALAEGLFEVGERGEGHQRGMVAGGAGSVPTNSVPGAFPARRDYYLATTSTMRPEWALVTSASTMRRLRTPSSAVTTVGRFFFRMQSRK